MVGDNRYENYEGIDVNKQFEKIDDISYYNNTYYVGLLRGEPYGIAVYDILYGKSDDDFVTYWYILNTEMSPPTFEYLGYSEYINGKEILHLGDYT